MALLFQTRFFATFNTTLFIGQFSLPNLSPGSPTTSVAAKSELYLFPASAAAPAEEAWLYPCTTPSPALIPCAITEVASIPSITTLPTLVPVWPISVRPSERRGISVRARVRVLIGFWWIWGLGLGFEAGRLSEERVGMEWERGGPRKKRREGWKRQNVPCATLSASTPYRSSIPLCALWETD